MSEQVKDNDLHQASDIAAPGRQAWQRPRLSCVDACDAETGVNSTTDATNTFS